jgi:hypothetical protein
LHMNIEKYARNPRMLKAVLGMDYKEFSKSKNLAAS